MVNEEFKKYVESYIIPLYSNFDKAHDENHVRQVIENSLLMAKEYNLDENIIYAAAAYHDIGLSVERNRHEVYSKEIMFQDEIIQTYFTADEQIIIGDAILTHRASNKTEPKTLYGKVIADSDNDLQKDRIIERMLLYSIDHYPEYSKSNHLVRCYNHAIEKYGETGYLKLWLDSNVNKNNLNEIRKIIADKKLFEKEFSYYYDKHVNK